MSKYVTKVINHSLDPNDEPILGIEVPYGFLVDFDLKVNEVLEWEIDPETRTAKITKTNIILNK